MRALVSLPVGVLFLGSVAVFGVLALVLHWAIHRLVPARRRESAGTTAAAYMTALGSLFAILTGFLINTEYASVRQTQNLVAQEAAAATRLAWATEGLPSVDAALVQTSLASYLRALDEREWEALADNEGNRSDAFEALAVLQGHIFDIGSRAYAPASSVEGMRGAVSDLTSIRRERMAIASQAMPAGLFWLSVLSGLALIVNAIMVTVRSGQWASIVAAGIVIIVALDLALVLGLSAPFLGAFQAEREPLVELYAEVRSGLYLPWVQL